MTPPSSDLQKQMANAVRVLSMDGVEKANSGHPGMPMGAADFATVLFSQFLKFDAGAPDWPDRDRFILSAGHGSMLLYSLLYLTGYEDMTIEEIKRFRQLGSRTAGHPEHGFAGGIETTTGPLGQGLGNAVGFAIAERHLNARFGDDLINHKTYALVGDGCLMEGISQEALSLAGHLQLKNLIVLWDDNNITIDGKVSLADGTDQLARFAASGWHTAMVDGYDHAAIANALRDAHASDRPSFIACKTIIGYGAPNKANSAKVHGSPLGAEEVAATRKNLQWEAPPFVIPEDLLKAWRAVGAFGRDARMQWQKRLDASGHSAEFERAMKGDLPENLGEAISAYKKDLAKNPPSIATRIASQNALAVVAPIVPEIMGGSADLAASNNTRTPAMADFQPGSYGGRNINFGIRELGMAAALNGLALHGGIIPFGGTFMCFTDYARPAIRLSALMHQRVIYWMTHDSIGLGEDGPTHQPVEHLAALRAIPNLAVFRPGDAVETAECWQLMLERRDGPSLIALSRQKMKPARIGYSAKNLCAQGAYEIAAAPKASKAVIFATGSELEIALEAKELLDKSGTPTRVVSVPCMELFAKQSKAYREKLLGTEKIRIAVEAGIRLGWDSFIGEKGRFIGMTGFGASAPADELYKHFGITAKAVVKAAKA